MMIEEGKHDSDPDHPLTPGSGVRMGYREGSAQLLWHQKRLKDGRWLWEVRRKKLGLYRKRWYTSTHLSHLGRTFREIRKFWDEEEFKFAVRFWGNRGEGNPPDLKAGEARIMQEDYYKRNPKSWMEERPKKHEIGEDPPADFQLKRARRDLNSLRKAQEGRREKIQALKKEMSMAEITMKEVRKLETRYRKELKDSKSRKQDKRTSPTGRLLDDLEADMAAALEKSIE